MKAKDFLARVWPADGQHIIVLDQLRKDGQGTWWNHRPVKDTLDAHVTMRTARVNEKVTGVYYALASFKSDWIEQDDGSRKTGRQATNVAYVRAIAADLDCKGLPGEYNSQKDGIAHTVELVQRGLIPEPSLFINSGRGIHLIWIAKTDIPLEEWRGIANGFKAHLLHIGMKIDKKVTGDAARLLRMPGSLHKKDPKNPREVVVLPGGDRGHRYEWSKFPQRTTSDDRRAALITPGSPNALKRCPAIAEMAQTQGANVTEPEWQLVALMSTFVEDGLRTFHSLSCGHATYDAAKTSLKYSQAQDKRKLNPSIRVTCQNMFDAGNASCKTCALRSKIRSPLDLIEDRRNKPPPPYFVDQSGVRMFRQDAQGEMTDVRVFGGRVRDMLYGTTPEGKRWLAPEVNPSGEKWTRTVLEYEKLVSATGETVNQHLTNAGLWVYRDASFRDMSVLFTSWAEQLTITEDPSHRATSVGWTGNDAWVAPSGHISAGKLEPVVTETYSGILQPFVPKGELSRWQDAAELVIHGSMPLQIVLALGFAAPLCAMAELPGFLWSFRSDASGTGKSTASEVALAVWQDPKSFHQTSDTVNAVRQQIRDTPNTLHVWDEVRFLDDRAKRNFIDLIHSVVNGKDKSRLNADLRVEHGGTSNTMLAISTNQRLNHLLAAQTHIDAAALMARTFEFEVPKLGRYKASDVDVLDDVHHNYGHAGPIAMQYITKNAKQIRKFLVTERNKLMDKFRDDGVINARYHAKAMATVMVGAAVAKQTGLVPFDLRGMRDYMVAHMYAQRVEAMDLPEMKSARTDNWQTTLREVLALHMDRWMVTYKDKVGQRYTLMPRKPPLVHFRLDKRDEMLIRPKDMGTMFDAAADADYWSWRRQLPARLRNLSKRHWGAYTALEGTASRMFCIDIAAVMGGNVDTFIETVPTEGSAATHYLIG